MSRKAPGMYFRKGLTTKQIFQLFPDNPTAEAWFVQQRWPQGVRCPSCNSTNIQTGAHHKTMPYRCREKTCAKRFSAKTGTVMEGSKIGFQDWMIATYLFTTSLKSISSMKLHREFGITQKSAWFLSHRIRKALEVKNRIFAGPVEVDETYVGGLEKNKHLSKKHKAGRGWIGKDIVMGIKDRPTNQVYATVIDQTDQQTVQAVIHAKVKAEATTFTDEHGAYRGLPNHHAVNHGLGRWVDHMAHTNGIESFWATLKKGFHGTFHHMSRKHLSRYVGEFAERHNIRPYDTIDQMTYVAQHSIGKRLTYRELIAS